MDVYCEEYIEEQRTAGTQGKPYGFMLSFLLLICGAAAILGGNDDVLFYTLITIVVLAVIYAGLALTKVIDWVVYDPGRAAHKQSLEWKRRRGIKP